MSGYREEDRYYDQQSQVFAHPNYGSYGGYPLIAAIRMDTGLIPRRVNVNRIIMPIRWKNPESDACPVVINLRRSQCGATAPGGQSFCWGLSHAGLSI